MNIAHYFTLIRIFIGPLFLLIYLIHNELGISSQLLPYLLISLLTLSEASDACDGYFARKYNQVTDLGKILDPMADSIYRISIFLTFTASPVNLPLWIVFILFYRDSVIATLRTLCALKGYALAARMSGKIKAVFQGSAALLILLSMIMESLGLITPKTLTAFSTFFASIAAVYTIYSGFDYIFANRSYLSKALNA